MGQVFLWNTISGRKEEFIPLDEKRVTMYVCGPTVYNHIHIGNARPLVVFDTLYRLLSLHYPEVIYARNITDIDDKIIAKAQQEGQSIEQIASHYSQSFAEDSKEINTLTPSLEPKATDHIEGMIDMVTRLVDQGFAYCAQGNVLFEVSKMPDYGKLSHRNVADMRAGARVEVADYKRDPADFTLWKPSNDNEPGWDSPWGRGRPGWHLECSVMASSELGETIDIHGGGKDLVFPHHENEIAQSECAYHGKQFVRYWIHNGYITVDGDKMAKSVGNFSTLKEVLTKFPGEAIRFALLSAHYRKPLAWSDDLVRSACQTLDKWYRLIAELPKQDSTQAPDPRLIEALNNDLNTPQAISVLHSIAHQATTDEDSQREQHLSNLYASAMHLGLLGADPQQWARWTPDTSQPLQSLSDSEVETLIQQRIQARLDKDFATADTIRDQLSEAGIVLEDSDQGTQWSRNTAG